MSKKNLKYQLQTFDIQRIEMPNGAEILCLQIQNKKPCIWVLADPEAELKKRTFEIFGTGHNVPENAERKYIGTFQQFDGSLVFHCFELLKLK